MSDEETDQQQPVELENVRVMTSAQQRQDRVIARAARRHADTGRRLQERIGR